MALTLKKYTKIFYFLMRTFKSEKSSMKKVLQTVGKCSLNLTKQLYSEKALFPLKYVRMRKALATGK